MGSKIIFAILELIHLIPIIGKTIFNQLNKTYFYIQTTFIPYAYLLKVCLEQYFWNIVLQLSINNANVSIVITGDEYSAAIFKKHSEKEEEFKGITKKIFTTDYDTEGNAIFISNHRSIFDYLIINHIVQKNQQLECFSDFYSKIVKNGMVDETKFISWSSINSIPKLSTLFRTISRDENCKITPKRISEKIMKNNLSISTKNELTHRYNFVIFPEVNILTNEVKLIQNKICTQSNIKNFNNLLYPRFKNFCAILKLFRYYNKLKEETEKSNKDKKIILKEASVTKDILPSKNLNKTATSFSKWLYDITIVYYQPILVKKIDEEKDQSYYKLLQITPSFLQMISKSKENMPIIVRVNIQKKDITRLVKMKEKQWEKWLESEWKEKDKLIDIFETNIKLINE
ncbi:uncharacterized protein SCODWIG_01207 [Saccharomycodes ludwigii]|uniref:Uncharacterized protein n=1 Tax=Saccharomycodes ludwigii TaxID=36035 RepID=A0A376B427_9ASCO|nr:hypothetical protein SCDLUD_000807 [Saccharomycodes ludwigii]KAH3903190.1 hypothetical protein SCDLUD_000807 [Saccharomycodes ludwigii]SSD59446.1 uncharacterized protein SCODWIG_01207 [Saccharomycodes ludwigii]